MPARSDAPEVLLRPLTTADELAQGVAIQRETWGEGFTELVPATILMICQKVGGVAAGAFDTSGRMLGFVFGLTGLLGSRRVHWSHMLAVRPEARGLGIGRRMKLFQREQLLALGVEEVRWTYDPLVAQNAHLNLNDLGVEVERHVVDMYGSNTGSEMHSALGTDRFVVVWRIGSPEVAAVIGGARPTSPDAVPAVTRDHLAGPTEPALPGAPLVSVEIPEDIQAVRERAIAEARRWRALTRRAFEHYLGRGYRVRAFQRDPGTRCCRYVLETRESPTS